MTSDDYWKEKSVAPRDVLTGVCVSLLIGSILVLV